MVDPRDPSDNTPLVEAQLLRLASQVDVSRSEFIAERAMAQLSSTETTHGVRRLPRLAWAATAFVVAASPVVVSASARATVKDWLGIGGVRITREAPKVAQPRHTTTRPATLVDLGKPTTLVEAGRVLGFAMQVPRRADMRVPDAVYLSTTSAPGEVALAYAPGPGRPALTYRPDAGLVLTEFRGRLEGGYFQKALPPDATVESVVVAGRQGYWVTGPLHRFFYRDAHGEINDASVRLAGNTLLWTRDDITLRIESTLSKQDALAIAETVR